MRIRYVGDSAARDVPMSGASIRVERMTWVDLVEEATAAGVREEHARIIERDLASHPDWESESVKKAAKTRAAHAADTEEQA